MRNYFRSILFLTLSSAILFIGCNKDLELGPQQGAEYVPVSIGSYWVYDVDKYQFFGDYSFSGDTLIVSDQYSDTSIYQLKEEVFAEHVDLEGDPYFEIRRSVRTNSSEDWKLDSVWSSKIKGNLYIRDENNISYIRLHFPVTFKKEWDSNALNHFDTDSIDCNYARYEDLTPYTYNGIDYGDVLNVIFCEDSTALANHTDIEYYAKHIGLVYKEFHSYDYCFGNEDVECSGQEIIDNGTFYKMNLVEYEIK